MFTVRSYKSADYGMVRSWWGSAKESAPLPDMMPEESSFIVEGIEGEPLAAVTVYLTNTKRFALVDNLIGNPSIQGQYRKSAIAHLQKFLEMFAQEKGYEHLACMATKPELAKRYTELGYNKTGEGITFLLTPSLLNKQEF